MGLRHPVGLGNSVASLEEDIDEHQVIYTYHYLYLYTHILMYIYIHITLYIHISSCTFIYMMYI